MRESPRSPNQKCSVRGTLCQRTTPCLIQCAGALLASPEHDLLIGRNSSPQARLIGLWDIAHNYDTHRVNFEIRLGTAHDPTTTVRRVNPTPRQLLGVWVFHTMCRRQRDHGFIVAWRCKKTRRTIASEVMTLQLGKPSCQPGAL
jgi:hypothetical protein